MQVSERALKQAARLEVLHEAGSAADSELHELGVDRELRLQLLRGHGVIGEGVERVVVVPAHSELQ